MDEMLRGLLLYSTALSFFKEAVDDEIATACALASDWYPQKGTIDSFAEIILSRLDEDKLYREGVEFTDTDIEYFKNHDIPDAFRKALEKYNVKIDAKVENGKLWFRAR